MDNVFYDWERASKKFFAHNSTEEEIRAILGKKEGTAFINQHAAGNFRYFVMGPSGSGEKLKAENGLPFFDVMVHGYRRWLLVTEAEVQKVAEKAREALEFQQTSAYMFFEEKLPELKEEFGLKNYIECNQEPGDIIFVPPGTTTSSASHLTLVRTFIRTLKIEDWYFLKQIVKSYLNSTVNPSHKFRAPFQSFE